MEVSVAVPVPKFIDTTLDEDARTISIIVLAVVAAGSRSDNTVSLLAGEELKNLPQNATENDCPPLSCARTSDPSNIKLLLAEPSVCIPVPRLDTPTDPAPALPDNTAQLLATPLARYTELSLSRISG